jgi:hypothetical protein
MLVALVLAGCSGGGERAVSTDASGGGAPEPAVAGKSAGDTAQAGAASVRLVDPGSRIVRTANVRLEIAKDSLGSTIDKATAVVTRYKGIYAGSTTSVPRDGGAQGQATFRVPVGSYEQAIGELKALGRYRGEQSSSNDVSAEYVDLNAQLTSWKAQEQTYLRLLARARTVADVIAVQGQIQQAQQNIERLQGQINLLADQSALSTIVLELQEPAAAGAPSGTFAKAWATALAGLQWMAAAVFVLVVWLVPVTALVLLVMLVVRLARRQRVVTAPRSADG